MREARVGAGTLAWRVLAFAALPGVSLAATTPAPPWQTQPFAADPRALVKAAAAASAAEADARGMARLPAPARAAKRR